MGQHHGHAKNLYLHKFGRIFFLGVFVGFAGQIHGFGFVNRGKRIVESRLVVVEVAVIVVAFCFGGILRRKFV